MDAKTLKALKASIAKWERNAVAELEHEYRLTTGDCPLCGLFLRRGTPTCCGGCPVYAKTGVPYCDDTPYGEAVRAADCWEDDDGQDARGAARAEVAFLKSLLPDAEGSP